VIFVKGEGGVPEDRPQGLAWLTLAAERDDKNYVSVRDRVRTALTTDEAARARSALSKRWKKKDGEKRQNAAPPEADKP
jgi:hypothetical protein